MDCAPNFSLTWTGNLVAMTFYDYNFLIDQEAEVVKILDGFKVTGSRTMITLAQGNEES